MKSLLLIPLILLSSCTINWNDEKDKKIAELQKQIQDDSFKKKEECKNTDFSIENLEKYEKIYSRKFNTCYIAWKVKDIERYWIRDMYTNNYTFRIEFDGSWNLLSDKTIWIDNKVLEADIDTEKRAKCEFNNTLKNIKWNDYPNHTDFISISCN